MLVSELAEKLKELPQDAEVIVDIEVESGFYDVPARHAKGRLWYVEYYGFVRDLNNRVTLKAKS